MAMVNYYLSFRYQRAFVDFFEDELVNYGYDWRRVVAEYLFEGKQPLFNSIMAGCMKPILFGNLA